MKVKNIVFTILAVGVAFAAYKIIFKPKKRKRIIQDRGFEIEVEIDEETDK